MRQRGANNQKAGRVAPYTAGLECNWLIVGSTPTFPDLLRLHNQYLYAVELYTLPNRRNCPDTIGTSAKLKLQ